MPPTPTATAARPRWTATVVGLAVAVALLVVPSSPAEADHDEGPEVSAPAVVQCVNAYLSLQWPGSVSSFFTDDPPQPQAARDFEWDMYGQCAVLGDGSGTALADVTLQASGTGTGWCDLSEGLSGSGTLGGVHLEEISWEHVGRNFVFDFQHDAAGSYTHGSAQNAWGTWAALAFDCLKNHGDTHFNFHGLMFHLPASDAGDLIDQEPPDDIEDNPSDLCRREGGDRIVNSTTQGVHTSVYVHQPSTGEVWLCGRVEDGVTGDGYGGRLEVTPTDPDPTIDPGESSEPDLDSNSTACTTAAGNDAPGSRPLSQGGIGPLDYMVDAYVGDDEAWLCVQAGSQDNRVMFPLGVGGTPGASVDGSVATWYPDDGTPTL